MKTNEQPAGRGGRPVRLVMVSRYPHEAAAPRGGVESVTKVLAQALAGLGRIDLHVVTLERGRRDVRVDSDGAVKIHRLPASRWPQMLDVQFGPGRKRLMEYLEGLRPDLVHAHETYGLMLQGLAAPVVFTVHGFDSRNLPAESARMGLLRSWLWRGVERRGLARQRHVISISPYVRKMIEPHTPATIHDIDNPVEECFFAIERNPRPGRVLCVGWLNDRKNPLGAIEAFAAAGIEGNLVFAGDTKDRDYRRKVVGLAAKRRVQHRVELLGHVNRHRLVEELSKAAVLLLASRQENAPMAVAEAMAAGVPVIASNRCGMPYMVEDGRSGFLVDPENPRQMGERLGKLVSSPDLLDQMGAAGREIAMERFHPASVARKTMDVYEAVLQASRDEPVAAAGPRRAVRK